jgi:ORF6N domain
VSTMQRAIGTFTVQVKPQGTPLTRLPLDKVFSGDMAGTSQDAFCRRSTALYSVETKRFNGAVKRNLAKFPTDFMFALTQEEWESSRSQFATLNTGRGRRRKDLPYGFTEHGALMAATILNNPRAVDVAIYVVRAFVRLCELAATHGDLAQRLDELEAKTEVLAVSHDSVSRRTQAQLKQVFEALRSLMTPPDPPKRPIGFVMPKGSGSKASSQRM